MLSDIEGEDSSLFTDMGLAHYRIVVSLYDVPRPGPLHNRHEGHRRFRPTLGRSSTRRSADCIMCGWPLACTSEGPSGTVESVPMWRGVYAALFANLLTLTGGED
jgi:hypothetical protein